MRATEIPGCSLFGTPDTAKVPQLLTTPPAVNMEVLPGTPQPLVFFDVETTSLSTSCDLAPLAAKVCGSEARFSKYVTPSRRITPGATASTGLAVKSNQDGSKQLYKDGTPVPSVPASVALQELINWLQQLHVPIVLVGDNC